MSTKRPIDPAAVRRVLLVRPRFLGDVCLTLPALDQVRAMCPAARVAYVTERESAPLLEGDPRVDELIPVDREAGAADSPEPLRRLPAFPPAPPIHFFCNPRTPLWVRASGAPARVGPPTKC